MTQFLSIPPKEGEYIAHLSHFEMSETRRHRVPYIRARATLLDGPDKGGTVTAIWGIFWWEKMLQVLEYLPEERFDFEKIQGDWLITIRNIDLGPHIKTEILLRAKA